MQKSKANQNLSLIFISLELKFHFYRLKLNLWWLDFLFQLSNFLIVTSPDSKIQFTSSIIHMIVFAQYCLFIIK